MASICNASCYNVLLQLSGTDARRLAFPSRVNLVTRHNCLSKPTFFASMLGPAITHCSTSSTLLSSLQSGKEQILENPLMPLKVERFYLPELYCSFPTIQHPDYESIKGPVFSWLLEWARIRNEQERNWLIQSDMPGLVCRILPETPRKDRLLLLGKVCVWVSCLDDIGDDPEQQGADATAFGHLKDLIEKALDGDTCSVDQIRRRDIKAMSRVFEVMRQDMGPRLYKRFVKGIKSFLLSSHTQVGERESKAMPDVSTYIANRRKTFAFDYIEAIMEYGMGVELDDETLQMESLKELQAAAVDYIAWTNDLLSFRKEYLKGDLSNLVPIVYLQQHRRQRQGDQLYEFQEAVNEVCDMIGRRERDFIRLIHKISLSDVAVRKPELRIYLQNLPYLLSGHLEWYYSSARFHGLGHSVSKFRQGYFVMDPHKTIVIPHRLTM